MADCQREQTTLRLTFAARADDLTKSSKSDAISSNLISENIPTLLRCIWWLWLLDVNTPHLLKWWNNSSTKYDLPFTQECATSCVAAAAESRLARLQNNNNHLKCRAAYEVGVYQGKVATSCSRRRRKRCLLVKRTNGHRASSSITGGQSALRCSTRGTSEACSLHSPSYIMLD